MDKVLNLKLYVAGTPPEAAVKITESPLQKVLFVIDVAEIAAAGNGSSVTFISPELAKQELTIAVL